MREGEHHKREKNTLNILRTVNELIFNVIIPTLLLCVDDGPAVTLKKHSEGITCSMSQKIIFLVLIILCNFPLTLCSRSYKLQ